MRIAYVANYQGPTLVHRRPCLHNFSLAARSKTQLIAELLRQSSHEVEIISQGSLEPQTSAERARRRFYPAFDEPERFHPDIPVHYASALAVRFLIGVWEGAVAGRALASRHRPAPFDAVIINNMQPAQRGCARYARRLGVPVILQYEDDSFVDVHGRVRGGWAARAQRRECRALLRSVSGATGVSTYLLSQLPSGTPRLLLRGVVSHEILRLARAPRASRKNWIVFSGTHESTQGLEQLFTAWRLVDLPGWELHVAGRGPLTATLERMAGGDRRIVFHGLLDREQNAALLAAAKIGLNPQDVTSVPGSVFATKIVEYLASGAHVISTPRGPLEPELEAGITYIDGNSPEAIAACLVDVIAERRYESTVEQAALRAYGPDAVAASLNQLLEQAVARARGERSTVRTDLRPIARTR